jgi:hypothetical protein
MIGAAKAYEMRSARVISRQSDRLHHSLCPRHMEGDFIEARNGLEPRYVLGDHGMICPENWPEVPHSLPTCFHARFVKIVAKKVNPIRGSQVVETIAIKISEHHALDDWRNEPARRCSRTIRLYWNGTR